MSGALDRSGMVLLRSDALEVHVWADKGADICALIDRRSGVDLMWKTPWSVGEPSGIPWTGDSQVDWLARYPGGWQQLVPNAGPGRVAAGVRQGYHGEAAIRPWRVLDLGPDRIVLSVDLFTAPVRLTRSVRIDGDSVVIDDELVNRSDESLDVRWVQHPGFGPPFVDEHCVIETGAATFVSDAEAPGSILAADQVSDWPFAVGADGARVDLRTVPPDRRSVFGALTDFEAGWFSITSPTTGLSLRMEWDADVFPHAWFWQELHATEGFPWFGRAYVVAVEPANVLPGKGCVGNRIRGGRDSFEPRTSRVSRITVRLADGAHSGWRRRTQRFG